jgi:hypothetical protein
MDFTFDLGELPAPVGLEAALGVAGVAGRAEESDQRIPTARYADESQTRPPKDPVPSKRL